MKDVIYIIYLENLDSSDRAIDYVFGSINRWSAGYRFDKIDMLLSDVEHSLDAISDSIVVGLLSITKYMKNQLVRRNDLLTSSYNKFLASKGRDRADKLLWGLK